MDVQSDTTQASVGACIPAEFCSASLRAPDVLIVDGDASVRGALSSLLRANTLRCREAHDSEQARRCIAERRPSLILLDRMLPDASGLVYLGELKRERRTADIPIIMLSARAAEQDQVVALDCGADDYITKPIASRELVARIQALLRRIRKTFDADRAITIGGLILDPSSHRVLADGRTCAVGPTEYRLLEVFMSEAGSVHDRRQLLERLWPDNAEVNLRTVDVYVRRLRQALAPSGYDRLIRTVHRAGYRFERE